MRIAYHEEDDTLFMEFSQDRIVRDESVDWHINIGYTENGIGEITILDAAKNGYYPFQAEQIPAKAA